MNKTEMLAMCRAELYSAVISDTLDTLGYHDQAMSAGINPLLEDVTLAGFARTGIYMSIFHDDDAVNVYEHEIGLVDSLVADDVIVLSCSDNVRIAPWGELLSTRARYLNVAGCITDGSVRDVRAIRSMGFPVFAKGRSPVDTKYRGKMMWQDVPARVGGVLVNPGDLVLADLDGIVVVPQALTEEVVNRSLQKVRAENTIREELKGGATLNAVFERHRIL